MKRNVLYGYIIASVVIAFAMTALLKANTLKVKKIQVDAPLAGNEYLYEIESATPDNSVGNEYDSYFTIRGWSGKEKQSVQLFDTQVLLKSDSDDFYYALSTDMAVKEELGNYKDTGITYMFGGFVARFDTKKVKPGTYTIYIWNQNDDNNVLICTDKTISL